MSFAPESESASNCWAGVVLHSVALLGGTFDPIHIGHLRSALELRERFGFEQIRLIPCHRPPHRGAPGASAAQRLQMLELALAGETQLRADDRELKRAGPSYTFDTLTELRAELGAQCSLSLIMGCDAFAELETWHRWRELLQLAHIVVMARPHTELPVRGAVAELLAAHRAEPAALQQSRCGAIVVVELTPLPIAATDIRALIRGGRSPRYLLPDAVWSFIREHALYELPAARQSPSTFPREN
jgi:nicotinate-nucleotide adenylyltransferase